MDKAADTVRGVARAAGEGMASIANTIQQTVNENIEDYEDAIDDYIPPQIEVRLARNTFKILFRSN